MPAIPHLNNGTEPHRSCVKVIKQRVIGSRTRPPEEDLLAIEDPLEIELVFNSSENPERPIRLVTMRTPGNDIELIHGFLYGEGIIREAQDVLGITFNKPVDREPPIRASVRLRSGRTANTRSFERSFSVQSSCGVCGTPAIGDLALPTSLRIEDETRIDADWIHSLPEQMNQEQETFHQTGGLHAAAIFSPLGALLASREDIGRHNALDKAIGANLIAGRIPGRGHVLCVSGRMSYEILKKALIAGIPIIAGVGAPSSLAVTLANDFNVTLIGFVRGDCYNIYSCPERLKTT